MSFDIIFGLVFFGGGIAIGLATALAIYAICRRRPQWQGLLAGAAIGFYVGYFAALFVGNYCAWGGC